MSFITENSKLVEQLIAAARQHNSKFTKRGQDAESARQTLVNHLKTLQDQLAPDLADRDPNAGPSISNKGSAALGSEQLESLDALVQWLATNESKVNGKDIVLTTKPEDDDYVPYGQFFVNPDALHQYVLSLQANAAQNPNPVLQKQLSLLIKDANASFGTEIKEQYQAPEKALNASEVLDQVPQIMDPSNPSATGNIPLTYGDLNDTTTFIAWLTKYNVSVKGNMVYVKTPGYDFKKVVDALVARAQYLIIRATPADIKNKAELYLRQASRLDSQFQGTAPTSQPAPGTSTNQPQNTATSPQTQRLADDAVENLPLALQNINFARINDFFGKIAQLMSNNSTVMSYIQNTRALMQKATFLTANNDTFFQLGISVESLVNMLKDPHQPGKTNASNFYTLVQLLDQIVDNTRAVVGYFMSQYANQLTPAQRAFIFGQIGKRPDDSSIYSRNIEYLNQWANTSNTTS